MRLMAWSAQGMTCMAKILDTNLLRDSYSDDCKALRIAHRRVCVQDALEVLEQLLVAGAEPCQAQPEARAMLDRLVARRPQVTPVEMTCGYDLSEVRMMIEKRK